MLISSESQFRNDLTDDTMATHTVCGQGQAQVEATLQATAKRWRYKLSA